MQLDFVDQILVMKFIEKKIHEDKLKNCTL